VLALTSDHPSCTSAQTPNKYYYVAVGVSGVNENLAKNIYAAAMRAFSTGKQVSVLFDDASSFCYVSAIVVTD
jgi:hypothetical protein